MDKEEFLEALRHKLLGEVSTNELENNIRYYDEYITEAVRNGRSELEVISELGNPVLIARTIIDTSDGEEQIPGQESSNNENGTDGDGGSAGSYKNFELNSKRTRLYLVLTIVAVLFIVLLVVGTILRIFLPLLLPFLFVVLLVSIFRGTRRR